LVDALTEATLQPHHPQSDVYDEEEEVIHTLSPYKTGCPCLSSPGGGLKKNWVEFEPNSNKEEEFNDPELLFCVNTIGSPYLKTGVGLLQLSMLIPVTFDLERYSLYSPVGVEVTL
jgi:hypothetical protein